MEGESIFNKILSFFKKAWKKFFEYIKNKPKWKFIDKNILICEDKKLIKLYNKTYPFSSIIDCELIEDGNSVIKSSLLGTAVKGFTFGLAGYLSSAKKEKKLCNKLEVKITVNDFDNPCIFFKYITKKTRKNSKDYENAFNKAQKCLSTIKLVIENK